MSRLMALSGNIVVAMACMVNAQRAAEDASGTASWARASHKPMLAVLTW